MEFGKAIHLWKHGSLINQCMDLPLAYLISGVQQIRSQSRPFEESSTFFSNHFMKTIQ